MTEEPTAEMAVLLAVRDQVRLMEVAYNCLEGEPREPLYKWLRDFAIKSEERLVVELVAGWIGCDEALTKLDAALIISSKHPPVKFEFDYRSGLWRGVR